MLHVDLEKTLSDKYSAAGPMLGYLYQCRYALLRSLEEGRNTAGLSVSIERFDDVAFDRAGEPVDLIQTKHHGTPGDLSDSSVDVWKTLQIWMDRIVDDPVGASDIRFVLLTTSTAAAGSAIECLRTADNRDDINATAQLTEVAITSRNQNTKKTREQFLEMTSSQKMLLISRIWVFDNAPSIIDVEDELGDFLRFAAPMNKRASLLAHLEGWWFSRTIIALSDPAHNSIPLTTIEDKVFEISNSLKMDGLPLDETIDAMDPVTALPSDDLLLIKQLNLVGASEQTAKIALRDYFRAFAQRSRWARENLLLDREVERYDRSLTEDWEHEFTALCEDVEGQAEQEKRIKGRELLRWANRVVRPLRGRDEMWLSRGSYQMLADTTSIGWHPEFRKMLTESIEQDS